MKILISILLLVSLTGCYQCPYCREDKQPDYVRHTSLDKGNGVKKETKWYGWSHYEKLIPQPDKVIDVTDYYKEIE